MDVVYSTTTDRQGRKMPAAVRFGDLVFASGRMAVNEEMRLADEVKPLEGYPWHGSNMERQLKYLYSQLGDALDDVGSSLDQVVKINSYHTKPAELDMALRYRKEVFGTDSPPPSTLLVAEETLVPEATVTIDVVAATSNSKRKLRGHRPDVNPHTHLFGWQVYSQAVGAGGFVFTAGVAAVHSRGLQADPELAADPASPYSRNVFRRLSTAILEELSSILEEANCSRDDVVKADIYLEDVRHLATLNEMWADFFPDNPPARTITPLPLSRGRPNKLLEIELIALDPRGPHRKETVSVDSVPTPLGPEPQAVKAGPFLFLSTQLATDYVHGLAPEARPDVDFPFHASQSKLEAQTVFGNVEKLSRAVGTSPENMVKRRVAHTSLADWINAEEVWRDRLGDRVPAATVYQCSAPLTIPACSVQYDIVIAIP